MDAERVVPDVVRHSYLRKIAALILGVLLVLGLVGLYASAAVGAQLTAHVHDEMEVTGTLESDNLDQWLADHEQNARTTADLVNERVTDQERQQVLQTQQNEGDDTTRSIHLVDVETGEIVMSTEAQFEGTSLEEYDVQWQDGELDQYSDRQSQVYEEEDKSVIAFASPVGAAGETAVVVTADVEQRAEAFENPIDGGYTEVVSADGTVQASTRGVGEEYVYGTDAEHVQQAIDGESGVQEVDRGDRTEIVAYEPLDETDSALVVHVPTANAYAVADTVQQYLLAIIGLSVVGFLFVGATIGRSTARELTRLSERAQAIAAGDLDVTIDTNDRIDEVGQVNDSFREIHEYVTLVATQADSIADQQFDDDVLEADVPGQLGDALDRMRTDLEEFIEETEAARADAERAKTRAQDAQADAEELASSLEEQARTFSETMELAADGDLTQRLDPDVDDEAMAAIARSFNTMLADLERTIDRIKAFSREVDGSSQRLAETASELQQTSREVNESIREIAEGAERQDENVQSVAREMNDLSATIEEVAASAQEVAATTQETAALGTQGSEFANTALAEIASIEAKADATIDEVERLNEEMDAIGEIVDVIDDIADQTNLLALNASIEAASAGEEGQGFAVVANEIKSLAEETSEATEEIEALIDDVQASTARTTEDIHEMGESVGTGVETVEEAVEILEEIGEQVTAANESVQSISEATDDQAASTEEIVAMTDEVSAISEETTSQTDEVAAATEQQTASIESTTDDVGALSDRSAELRELLDEFETETESGSELETDSQEEFEQNARTESGSELDATLETPRPPTAGDRD